MRFPLELLLPAIPLLPLLAGLAARRAPPAAASRLGAGAAATAALLAAAATAGLAPGKPLAAGWDGAGLGALAFSLRLDGVSAVMALLVSLLGAVVLRFSRNYLAGDPAQSRFLSWMCLTQASVLTLVLSGHLLLLLAAWVATSLSLHRLLLHCPGRPGAVFSARKKFVVSRLADLCLLAASLLLHRHFGTWDLGEIFPAVAQGRTGGLEIPGLLLVACAALKSAQFPFHSWLPDTMETPTPVSAFMHAGVVNGGGFLIVRMAPVLAATPAALHILAALGAVTAAFGAVVMLAQPGVKRALAYSTIAQMGFMMLQCGLGAFGLALLHIVAHSLYKAHAFLTAGSTIGLVPRAAVPLGTRSVSLGLLCSGLLVSGLATALQAAFPGEARHPFVFGLILALALGYGLARLWSAVRRPGPALRGLATAAGLALAALGLHLGVSALFAHLPSVPTPAPLLAFVGAVFVSLFLFQALVWRAGRHPLGQRLYVHALNGFYVGTLANRLLGFLWPVRSSL